jgi:two-component system sensor histidine kinase/response regulator
MADPGKLRQILVNLLGNAVKFTRTGFVTLHVLRSDSDRITFDVQDSGIGISPEEMKQLFRPFERTRSGEQAAGGTGLGLAISQEYARLMGGNVTVTSIAGEGSHFRFEFPAQSTSVRPALTESSPRITRLVPGQGEIRVLVVDDQGINRKLLCEMLKPMGFTVDEAENGKESIEKAQAIKPHIILMDLIMPGMGGGEATHTLRRIFPNDPPAIIGISASAFEDTKQQFLDAGINAFITKPIREHDLYDAITRYAGVQFEREDFVIPTESEKIQAIPDLDRMPGKWCESLKESLVRNNITRIRKLAEEAQALDPALADWMLERTARYDIDDLKRLLDYDE